MTDPNSDAGWHPASWLARVAGQIPAYRDTQRAEAVMAALARLPPLVTSWEVDALREQLALAGEGKAFILQGGDCAETFDDCRSDVIVTKLKILLQMSVVIISGLKRPVVRVGRMAGQYAKPRSADTETRTDQTLPSYRGDIINRNAFTAEDREPDPELMLRAYERSGLTLNFIRSLIDGGFADLHHPENWDLDWVSHSPLADQYRRTVQTVADGLDFFESLTGKSIDQARRVDFFASHEGLHLPYEQAQTRFLERRQAWYDLTTHFPWIGVRTSQLDGAHVEFFRGIRNPIGVKIGPDTTPAFLRGLLAGPESRQRAGTADADSPARSRADPAGAAGTDRHRARGRRPRGLGLRSHARQYRDGQFRTEDAAGREHPGRAGRRVRGAPRRRLAPGRRSSGADRRSRDGVHRRRARPDGLGPAARLPDPGRSATELRAGDGSRDANRWSWTSRLTARRFLASLTHRPGVYRMLAAGGDILYVGKARDLRKRVATYFGSKAHHPKTQALMAQTVRVEVTVTGTEQDALLLEHNLIKEHRPRFNVVLRDDKSYPWIYVSTQQEFPRFEFHRGSQEGARPLPRPVAGRRRRAGEPGPAAEAVPGPPVLRVVLCQPHPAVPAVPDPALHGALRRPHPA